MKKFVFLILVLFCTILGANAQSDTNWVYRTCCLGNSTTWTISIAVATDTDTCICNHNGILDTIIGRNLIITPDSTTNYVLESINGHQPSMWYVYACKVIVNIPPTFTVDSIHHVTCPDPYVHGNNPIPPGPWADGGFSVILNDSVQNYEYIWILNSSNIIMEEFHDDFTVSGLRGGTYNIISRGNNGCEVTQQVTIQQPPAWGMDSVIGESYITCSNTGILIFECIGGTPPYVWDWQGDYHWNPNDPAIWFEDSIMPYPNSSTISVNTPGEYYLRIIDSHGCRWFNYDYIGPFTVYQVLPDTVHLNYYTPEDSVTLIECPESMEVCQYKPFFNALSLGHGTYQWNTEWDTEFGHELDTTQNFTGPYQTGWLNVEFTDQNGCVTRDSVYLDIYDANIRITADSIMNDDSVYTVTVSPLGGTLYLDGIEIPIENGTISFDASQYQLGEHDLSYVGEWGAFGCYFDTTFHFIIQHQDGISEFERNTKLWPNPASNTLNIEFNGEFSGDIQLFDMTGRLLKTSEKESDIISIDVSDLTSGVYFIHFASQSGTFTKKFVKK